MFFKKNEVFPQAGFPRFFTLNFVTVSSFIISYSFLISYLEMLTMLQSYEYFLNYSSLRTIKFQNYSVNAPFNFAMFNRRIKHQTFNSRIISHLCIINISK